MKTKSPLKPEAIKLLRRVKRHILAEPRRYDQEVYIDRRTGKNGPPCGTACCIAGWCAVFSTADVEGKRVTRPFLQGLLDADVIEMNARKVAIGALGVSEYGHGIYSLFHYNPSMFWPEPFGSQWAATRTAKGRATIAAARIEHFIRTGE